MSAGLGLNMLRAPDRTEGVVDIVAVYGLSPQVSSWLSLSLPCDLPEARIFTYSYDFALGDIDLVDKQGRQLLEALSRSRSADNTVSTFSVLWPSFRSLFFQPIPARHRHQLPVQFSRILS